jgi:uncharacterized protein involved in outer membrane biogenesis
MKLIKYFFISAFAIFSITAAAILFIPSFVDMHSYKGFFEKSISQHLGYKVKINGDFQVQMLPNIRIYADNITIAPTSGDGNLATINSAMISKKLSDFISFNSMYGEIIINRPNLNLKVTNDGNFNWEPLKYKNSSYYSRQIKNILNSVPNFEVIKIENANVNYHNLQNNKISEYKNLYFSANNKNIENVVLALKYKYKQQPVNIKSNINLKNINSIKTKVIVKHNDYIAEFNGFINKLYKLHKAEAIGKLQLQLINAKSLNFINERIALMNKYIDLNNSHISSNLSLSKNKLLLSTLKIDSEQNKLEGSGEYSIKSGKKTINVSFDAEQFIVNKPQIDKKKGTKHKLVWPEDNLDFSMLNNITSTINLKCIRCIYADKEFEQLNFRTSLENNNLVINQFSLETKQGGNLKFSATAGLNNPVALELKGEFVNLDPFKLTNINFAKNINSKFTGKTAFTLKGSSLKAMLANMQGSLSLNNSSAIFYKTDSANLFEFLKTGLTHQNGYSQAELTDFNFNTIIRDGVARSSDITFNLNTMPNKAKGKFDIANLTLNGRVDPENISTNNLGVNLTGNVNNLTVIADRITPKGVVDSQGRVISKALKKQRKQREVKTHFDYDDKTNMKQNVQQYLFGNQ